MQGNKEIDIEERIGGDKRRIIAAIFDFIGFSFVTSFPLTLSDMAILGPFIAVLSGVAAGLIYFIGGEYIFGQTIGKKLMKLKVVSIDGGSCGFIQAIVRNALRPIDALFGYGVGFLIMTVSNYNQRLGDIAAKTVVIKNK